MIDMESMKHNVKLDGAEALLRNATGYDARTQRAAPRGIERSPELDPAGRHKLIDHAYDQYVNSLKAVREATRNDPNYWEKIPASTRKALEEHLSAQLPPRWFFHDLIKWLDE